MVCAVVRRTFGVQSLPQDHLIGSQVNLASVIVWIIREQRLHKVDKKEVEFNIKLDGRPFWGKNILAIVGLNYIFHNYRYNSVFVHLASHQTLSFGSCCN